MSKSKRPFALPAKLPSDLERVRKYWESLKRGENNIPFWDDVNLASLQDVADRLLLVDAFENPQRFRFNSAGERIQKRYGDGLAGKFADEIAAKAPFEFFTAQADATIEAKAPTFFAAGAAKGSGANGDYARVFFPLWGRGRIEMLLGAISR
jgi:hypothetical protein